MSTARKRWRRTLAELRSAVVPVVAFWGMTALSLGLLFALYLVDQGVDEGVFVFVALVLTTFAGLGIGQLCALLRLRTWVVALLVALIWAAGVGIVALEPPLPEDIMIGFAVMLVVGPFFLMAGLWSLRVHMGLLATWAPLVYLTASIIVIAEQFTGSVSNWHAGEKWAVWDLFSLPVLAIGVVFLIVYLGARERHRVQLWRFAPAGPDLPETEAKRRPGERRGGGCGGTFAAIGLALAITAGAALAAPYLWRTGPADDGDGTSAPMEGPAETEPQPAPEPSQGCNQQQPEQGEGEGEGEGQQPQEQLEEAVKNAGISLLTLILVMIFLVVGLLIFLPPLRRALLLRHLRRPLWPVPPTRQVLLAWRVVEIALADIDIHRRPGDSAAALAERAVGALPPDVDHVALRRCAALADRVLFGLGVDPTDPEEARRTAEMTYQVVWELLSEAGRLRSVYRFV